MDNNENVTVNYEDLESMVASGEVELFAVKPKPKPVPPTNSGCQFGCNNCPPPPKK